MGPLTVEDGFVLVATALQPNGAYNHVRYASRDMPRCAVLDSAQAPLPPFVRMLECSADAMAVGAC